MGTPAVTFRYTWLFGHAGGSVLLVVVAHAVEGAIQDESLVYVGVWMVVALARVALRWTWWHRPAPATARTTPTARALAISRRRSPARPPRAARVR